MTNAVEPFVAKECKMFGSKVFTMSRRSILAGASASLLAGCAVTEQSSTNNPNILLPQTVTVAIETTQGTVQVALEVAAAPAVTAWFLALAEAGNFNGTKFFRSGHLAGQDPHPRFLEGGMLSPFVLGEVGSKPTTAAQAGLPTLSEWETTTQSGLLHSRGSVGLARDIIGDGSVIPDIVITLDTVSEFDDGSPYSPGAKGFPVIGYVTEGMELVDQIAATAREGTTYIPFLNGQIMSSPVEIVRVIRLGTLGVPVK